MLLLVLVLVVPPHVPYVNVNEPHEHLNSHYRIIFNGNPTRSVLNQVFGDV